jgi:hypothetical protein
MTDDVVSRNAVGTALAANTNPFYPFAVAGGANVLDNPSYEALPARQTGYVAGTALSIQCNSTWRQSSIIAAMIGQFINDNQPDQIADDGDIPTLEDQFENALLQFMSGQGMVQLQGPTYTYSPPYVGKMMNRSNTGNTMADILPNAASGLAPNVSFRIRNGDASALLSMSAQAPAVIFNVINNTLVLGPGQTVDVFFDGTNYFPVGKPERVLLGADTILYVNGTSGSDSTGNGLAPNTAFQTPQAAWNLLHARFDLNGHVVTVQVADGTYASNANPILAASGVIPGQLYPNSVIIQGNMGNPGNCLLDTSGGVLMHAVQGFGGAMFQLQGFRLRSSYACISSAGSGTIIYYQNCDFSTSTWYHVAALWSAFIYAVGSYTISGGGANCQHFDVGASASISVTDNVTITLIGNPTLNVFCAAGSGGSWGTQPGFLSFVGTCVGAKYYADYNGTIVTETGNINFFPGSVAGSVATGGQYG